LSKKLRKFAADIFTSVFTVNFSFSCDLKMFHVRLYIRDGQKTHQPSAWERLIISNLVYSQWFHFVKHSSKKLSGLIHCVRKAATPGALPFENTTLRTYLGGGYPLANQRSNEAIRNMIHIVHFKIATIQSGQVRSFNWLYLHWKTLVTDREPDAYRVFF
jgi:hypothetical protein